MMSNLPESLVAAARAGTLVPFVGAGVSVGAVHHLGPEFRFPDWKGLVDALADRLLREGQPDVAVAVQEQYVTDAMAAAQTAVMALGPASFRDEIERLFDRPAPRGADLSLVNAIWRLRPPFVITTNYDRVLAWPPLAPVRLIHNDDHTPLGDLAQPSNMRRVWHLHGSVARIDTVILTASQYANLYVPAAGAAPVKYQNAAERLRDLLKTRTFFFVGYSLDEPLLRVLLEQVYDVTAGAAKNKYLLLRAGQAGAAQQEALRDRYGVHVVEFEGFGAPLVAAVDGIARAAWPDELALSGPGLTQVMEPLVRALEAATAGVAPSASDVARLFNAARPAGWEAAVPGSDRVKQLAAAIRELGTTVSPPSGVHPLLSFADRLKDELVEPYKGRVSDWIDSAVEALVDDPARVLAIRQEMARRRLAAARRGAHVLVRIAPVPGAEGAWRAHAWGYTGGDPEVLLGVEGIDFAAGGEGDLVVALVEAIQTRDYDPAATTLAFLVPRELAVVPVDQWQLPRDIADDPPLGAMYLVAVRSLDRLRKHRILRQRFKKAWGDTMARAGDTIRVLSPGAAPAPGTIGSLWVDSVTACSGMLSTSLSAQDVRCVLLRDPPGTAQLAHLTAVLDTPVPVVLWCRPTEEPAATIEAAIRTVLEAGPLAELPQRVRLQRALALRPGGPPLGRHLALLWDDADYVPPDADSGARAALPTT